MEFIKLKSKTNFEIVMNQTNVSFTKDKNYDCIVKEEDYVVKDDKNRGVILTKLEIEDFFIKLN